MKKNKLSIYTDIALEAAEALYDPKCKIEKQKLEGVTIKSEEIDDISVTWVKVENERGAKIMGKPVGNYITLESEVMKGSDIDAHEQIIKILADKLVQLRQIHLNAPILIVGLGNRNVTPDALGPKVVSKALVTRHIMDVVPTETGEKVRSVAAVAPGVMGTTGIETCDIIKGICDKIKPGLVIAIDALAARKASRVNATIQLSDTGISPGAGMGNNRKAINEEFLGVPVIAIGVPTVVDAATLVNDSLDLMLSAMLDDLPENSPFYDMLYNLESEEKYELVKQSLDSYVGTMFVTPKEVDSVIERLSNIIANSINIALHPGIHKDDINRFMYS